MAKKTTKKRSRKATASVAAPPVVEAYESPMATSSEADAEEGAGAESDASSEEGNEDS